ncbi:CDK5 regulatory subunit-associated protein 2-like [Peromyscus maniculatus bairdii]|uniref:CDK5 regulatory subunit-associated protein 2-like n=1 Tax=Peromyscus maniculatus bairdii TaxID=230844 RepID=UPI001C2EB264|nr:CDK5 regulatory subunit-associated protein 2-like [Peromyscus maniculatus bairdii]
MSDKSSLSRDQKPDSETEKCPVMASSFSQDCMEHLQEIRTRRKRLEEYIKTNEKLQKQQERQGSEADQGSINVAAYGSELHSSLKSEMHSLRKQNQALRMMIDKCIVDKLKENEKLLKSLSRKAASLEHLRLEYISVKEENERLQRDISEKERQPAADPGGLQPRRRRRQELSRVQEEVKLKQQLLSQNEKEHRKLQREAQVVRHCIDHCPLQKEASDTSYGHLHKNYKKSWRDGSEVKSTGCSSKGPEFNSQQPHGS